MVNDYGRLWHLAVVCLDGGYRVSTWLYPLTAMFYAMWPLNPSLDRCIEAFAHLAIQ